jgi:hypothetical protein
MAGKKKLAILVSGFCLNLFFIILALNIRILRVNIILVTVFTAYLMMGIYFNIPLQALKQTRKTKNAKPKTSLPPLLRLMVHPSRLNLPRKRGGQN